MTEAQARKLLLYTVVYWDTDPADTGTVLEIGRQGVFIAWADGQRGWIDFRDMHRVHVR